MTISQSLVLGHQQRPKDNQLGVRSQRLWGIITNREGIQYAVMNEQNFYILIDWCI